MTDTARPERGARGVGASFALAYLIGGALLAGLVWAGGLWNLIANSRLLDLLMRSGVVAFTDADQGFYRGVPDAAYYVASQDPIDWGLLLLTLCLLIGVAVLRGFRFAAIERPALAGVSQWDVAQAHLYGSSVGAFYPYGYGRIATAVVLERSGFAAADVSRRIAVARFLSLLEIAAFTIVGVIALAWTTALGQLAGSALILGVAYFLMRPSAADRSTRIGPFTGIRHVASGLGHEPATLMRLGTVSALGFFGEAVAVYALSQAFSSTNVILNVDFPVILMAVAAGHLASVIEVTPGGLGQFEWGMALALYVGGLGIPEAVTIPMLYVVLRYFVAAVIGIATRTRAGVRSVSDVTDRYIVEPV